jgi:undecaprenyl-diphosphatase
MKIITNFAHAFTLVSIAILIMIFVKNKKIKIDVTLNLIVVFILNQIFKVIIARPRPITNINSVVEASGYSFPSAHAMVSFAFYGFLIYLIHQYIKNKKIKILLTIFLGLLILGIGISRIYLGVHYATDVIGGFVISAIYLYVFIKYIHKNSEPMV